MPETSEAKTPATPWSKQPASTPPTSPPAPKAEVTANATRPIRFSDQPKLIQFRASVNIPTVGPYSTVEHGKGGMYLTLHKAGIVVSVLREGQPSRHFLCPFAMGFTVELSEV